MLSFDDLIAAKTPEERARYEAGLEISKAQHRELHLLRQLYRKARATIAAEHGIQDIPAFEETADLFIMAMRESLKEMGGRLRYTLEFKDTEPLEIEGIADLGTDDYPADDPAP
jgi:hypothetical protein